MEEELKNMKISMLFFGVLAIILFISGSLIICVELSEGLMLISFSGLLLGMFALEYSVYDLELKEELKLTHKR